MVQGAVAFLKEVPFFRVLPEPFVEQIAEQARRVRYEAGGIVIRQGEAGRHFFVMLKGMVHVTQESAGGHKTRLATLRPGDWFGEVALLDSVPGTASVIADGAVEVLCIGRRALEEVVLGSEDRDVIALIRGAAALRRSPAFSHLSSLSLTEFLAEATPLSVQSDDVVIREGYEGDAFYVVLEGVFDVVRSGQAQPIARLGAGDHFGEMAILNALPGHASVVARQPGSLLSLGKAAFRAFVERHLSVSAGLERLAVRRMQLYLGSFAWHPNTSR